MTSRHVITGTGSGDCAHSFRFADRFRNLWYERVAPMGMRCNSSHTRDLKRSGLDVERQVDARTLTAKVLEHFA